MKYKLELKKNLYQIYAITEKDLKLRTRFKLLLILNFIAPIISLFLPLIVLGKFFDYNVNFGPWNDTTYTIFLLLVYNISLLRYMILDFRQGFSQEKFWETVQGLIIAPFNRTILLLGMYLANLIIIAIPFVFFLIVCYLIYPISLATMLFVLFIFFMISLTFAGAGMILGIFVLSNENIFYILVFLLNFVFWLSALSYPLELFPQIFQDVIVLNPFYYLFDILRLAWIQNDVVYTISNNIDSFLVLLACGIGLPGFGVIVFNKIFQKYGIIGY